MQASDYTHIDVTGVSIADKILPRIYNEANGAAKVERAEDIAFLWEALGERGEIALPSEYEQVTGHPGAINVVSRSYGATYAEAGGRQLEQRIESNTASPAKPSKYVDISGNVTWGHYDGWFDWSKVGGVVRREDLTSSEAEEFNIVSVFPGIFTDVSIPSDNGRYSNCRIMVDPLRYLYSRLAHSEGFVAWTDVTTWFTCKTHRTRTVGSGTAATQTEESESYGQLGSGDEVEMYWEYTPERTNENGEVVQEEERSVQQLEFRYASLLVDPVTYRYADEKGLGTDVSGDDKPVMIIRFHVQARPLDSVNSTLFPEKDMYIVDYLDMHQGTADLKTKFDALSGRFFPQTNYSYISITASFGPFLFPFSGKTKLRDLAGGAWDPARRS